MDLGGLIVAFFVLALVLLIVSLVLFLTEVQLATRTLRIGKESFLEDRSSAVES